jgi:hypothetical protein
MKTKSLAIQTQNFLIASLMRANSAVFAADAKVMISGGFPAACKTNSKAGAD